MRVITANTLPFAATLEELANVRRARGLSPFSTPDGLAALGPEVASIARPDAGNPTGEYTHQCVAAGGTFDRMHAGT